MSAILEKNSYILYKVEQLHAEVVETDENPSSYSRLTNDYFDILDSGFIFFGCCVFT